MGKVLSVAARKVKRFNVENRAHKVISMEKPAAAPRHPSSQKEIDLLMKDHGEAFEELKLKHTQLDTNLKQVYVTSTGADTNKFGKPSQQDRLPVNRSTGPDSELGYEEPEIIPTGKITLKQALRVLTDREVAARDLTAEKIAHTLNIKQQDAVNLVCYFSTLKIHMPEAVPQLSSAQKAKKIFLKPMSQTKVVSVQGSPAPLHLEDQTRSKPD